MGAVMRLIHTSEGHRVPFGGRIVLDGDRTGGAWKKGNDKAASNECRVGHDEGILAQVMQQIVVMKGRYLPADVAHVVDMPDVLAHIVESADRTFLRGHEGHEKLWLALFVYAMITTYDIQDF